jgi:membrane-associated phospholipid phosphatase
MPSLHVTIATLNALVISHHSRRLGIAAAVYAALVALASVHLGWHYAVDTYAGVLAAISIWFPGWRGVEGGHCRVRCQPPSNRLPQARK